MTLQSVECAIQQNQCSLQRQRNATDPEINPTYFAHSLVDPSQALNKPFQTHSKCIAHHRSHISTHHRKSSETIFNRMSNLDPFLYLVTAQQFSNSFIHKIELYMPAFLADQNTVPESVDIKILPRPWRHENEQIFACTAHIKSSKSQCVLPCSYVVGE